MVYNIIVYNCIPFVHDFVNVSVMRERLSPTILMNNIVGSASASHSPQDHSHIYSSSIDNMYTNSRQTGETALHPEQTPHWARNWGGEPALQHTVGGPGGVQVPAGHHQVSGPNLVGSDLTKTPPRADTGGGAPVP